MEVALPAPRDEGRVTAFLRTASPAVFTAYSVFAAFVTYFSMYGLRKAFPVGKFEGLLALPLVGAIDHKTLFIISQALGYCLSKFLGIKVVSELAPSRRAVAILVAIAIAELGLVVFGALPAPYGAIGMFVNGLPLGMVWGLVFGFLEGRKVSDFLGAGLCASYIVGSAFAKTVGRYVLGWGITERWMPATTGLLFIPSLVITVWMLAQLPPPTAEDERLRTKRVTMDAAARRAFFRKYALGLVLLIAGYVVLTALRDFRDNFARELWDKLGYAKDPAILTTSEIPVAAGAVACTGIVMVIKDNRTALLTAHAIMIGGAILAGLATLLFQLGVIGPVAWMISVGLGLYIGYVPFNCVLFDRMIAATGSIGTAGFLIYISDAFGYLGSTCLLLEKNLGQPKLPWLTFFEGFGYAAAGACTVLFGLSAAYFFSPERTPHT